MLYSACDNQNCPQRSQLAAPKLGTTHNMPTGTARSYAPDHTLTSLRLAPDQVQLTTTQQAFKLNSTNYTSSALRAATEIPATLNSLLSYDQHMPLNQIAPMLSKLKSKAASYITSLARTTGSACIRTNPPQSILSKLEESRLVGYYSGLIKPLMTSANYSLQAFSYPRLSINILVF
ncbi:hypothetical protein F511_13133 [Dorcoceras hygrometricum]|uniref:Uncharacterized protein n=1 Tax=Dorcoceras hygrometricum TaxID=472368 RepID=A0A2Z7D1B8_9LAMI|nr:hypothetical protein F511_13133 [Dorcoceras hygrometricum]